MSLHIDPFSVKETKIAGLKLTLPQLKQWDSCFYDRYIVTKDFSFTWSPQA